jgi:hypothetical protein
VATVSPQLKAKEEANARKEMFERMTPLGRIGRPEEMAKPSCSSAPMVDHHVMSMGVAQNRLEREEA